jgi:hypothetical protein
MIIQHGSGKQVGGVISPGRRTAVSFFFSNLQETRSTFILYYPKNPREMHYSFYVKLKPPLTAQLSPRNARTPTATLIEELGQAKLQKTVFRK